MFFRPCLFVVLLEAFLHPTYSHPNNLWGSQGYKYSEKTNKFYKYHNNDASWQVAVDTCAAEGAQLFYPVDEAEIDIVKELFDNSFTQDGRIHVGIFSPTDDCSIYETIDGHPLSDVFHTLGGAYTYPPSSYKCMTLHITPKELNNIRCNWDRSFICRSTVDSKDVTSITPTPSNSEETETEPSTSPPQKQNTDCDSAVENRRHETLLDDNSTIQHFAKIVENELEHIPNHHDQIGAMKNMLGVLNNYV